MNTRPYDRLRDSLHNLNLNDRAAFRDLARNAGCSREDLLDFAEIGSEPERAIIDKLEAWHEVHSLRQLLSRPRTPASGDIAAATGISIATLNDFGAGTADLDAASMQLLRDFLIGKVGQSMSSGSYIRSADAPAVAPMHACSAELSPEMRRRGQLSKEFAALPLDEQERILAPTRKTTRAA